MIRLQLIKLMKKEQQPPPRSRQQEGEFISSELSQELPTRPQESSRYPMQLKHKYQKKKRDTPKGRSMQSSCKALPTAASLDNYQTAVSSFNNAACKYNTYLAHLKAASAKSKAPPNCHGAALPNCAKLPKNPNCAHSAAHSHMWSCRPLAGRQNRCKPES